MERIASLQQFPVFRALDVGRQSTQRGVQLMVAFRRLPCGTLIDALEQTLAHDLVDLRALNGRPGTGDPSDMVIHAGQPFLGLRAELVHPAGRQ